MTGTDPNIGNLARVEADSANLVAESDLRSTISLLEPRRAYFIRHWQGRLSLPVSYWINSILATLAVTIVSAVVAAFAQPTEGLVTWALLIFGVWIFALVITVWQLVGVWRSAGNHKSRGGSGFWAGVARFMVILGFLSLAGTLVNNAVPQLAGVLRVATGDRETGSHTLKILRDGRELEFSGGITFGVTDEVQKILDIAPSIKVLHLNSKGGRVAEARKLRDLIKARNLITYTSTICASACTQAFLAGSQRYIAPDAKIGFHQVDFPGLAPQELAIENQAERRSLIEIGVPTWFAEKAFSTPSTSMWWPSLDDLKQARIVTAIARSNDFALSGLPSDFDRAKFEEGFLQSPTIVAIKRTEPDAYEKMLAAAIEGLKVGKSQSELTAVTMSHVTAITKKYIPRASDNAVSEMAQVLILEMDVIGSKDAEACYHFINPQPGEASVFIADYASSDLMKRDLAATAAVIETGAGNPQRVPVEAEVAELMTSVLANLLQRYSREDLAMLSDLNSPTVDRKRTCGIFSGLIREIISLSKRDQIRLLRYMFAQ